LSQNLTASADRLPSSDRP